MVFDFHPSLAATRQVKLGAPFVSVASIDGEKESGNLSDRFNAGASALWDRVVGWLVLAFGCTLTQTSLPKPTPNPNQARSSRFFPLDQHIAPFHSDQTAKRRHPGRRVRHKFLSLDLPPNGPYLARSPRHARTHARTHTHTHTSRSLPRRHPRARLARPPFGRTQTTFAIVAASSIIRSYNPFRLSVEVALSLVYICIGAAATARPTRPSFATHCASRPLSVAATVFASASGPHR